MNENTIRNMVVMSLQSTIRDLENKSLSIKETSQRLADIADMLAATVDQKELRELDKL